MGHSTSGTVDSLGGQALPCEAWTPVCENVHGPQHRGGGAGDTTLLCTGDSITICGLRVSLHMEEASMLLSAAAEAFPSEGLGQTSPAEVSSPSEGYGLG